MTFGCFYLSALTGFLLFLRLPTILSFDGTHVRQVMCDLSQAHPGAIYHPFGAINANRLSLFALYMQSSSSQLSLSSSFHSHFRLGNLFSSHLHITSAHKIMQLFRKKNTTKPLLLKTVEPKRFSTFLCRQQKWSETFVTEKENWNFASTDIGVERRNKKRFITSSATTVWPKQTNTKFSLLISLKKCAYYFYCLILWYFGISVANLRIVFATERSKSPL